MKKILFLFTICFMAIGCENEAIGEGYPEMEGFYTESRGLPTVTIDSVKSFSTKVNDYTTEYPESKKHSLYPKIQANIKSASLRITLTCDTTWAGETYINF